MSLRGCDDGLGVHGRRRYSAFVAMLDGRTSARPAAVRAAARRDPEDPEDPRRTAAARTEQRQG